MLWRRLAASILCWERLTGSYALIAIKKKLTTKDPKVHKGKLLVKFSDQFEARFEDMLTHYPTKRSVLVPTLLYAQDEVGYLNHYVIHEIAQRLELTDLEVSNVISYYSMLSTKPRGKFNVQVCTNIACMLRGGEELLDHCKSRLGIGHKGITPDGMFSLEEVECIGACSWAPAVQVNYDFHENLTAEKIDKILDGYKTN
jgi:NADH-quinone oxidoreductase subunit E